MGIQYFPLPFADWLCVAFISRNLQAVPGVMAYFPLTPKYSLHFQLFSESGTASF